MAEHALGPALARYQRRFLATWPDEAPVDDVRFVVLDCETTGLNPAIDRLVTIGAVAVHAGDILIADAISLLIRIDHNTDAVMVHGVTRDQARAGLEEADALVAFLDYLGDGVIVGHHIGHDIATLDVALARYGATPLRNRSLDTMDLTLHLERAGAFAGRPPIRHFTLDALCRMFGVIPHGRHTAAGDAFLTAQVFQRLVRLATRHDRGTVSRLTEPFPVDDPAS